MKKLSLLLALVALITSFNGLKAQTVEVSYDLSTILPDGGVGNAGVVFINGQFWITEWDSNDIHLLDNTGNYVQTFQIPGITGIRSMTTDGTSLFCATNSSTITKINPITRSILGMVIVPASLNDNARFCAYDASLNGGSGGFWIGNFATNIVSMDMNGNQLSVLPSATHGLAAMYGAAADGMGNLYVYDQGGTSEDRIMVIDLSTGIPIGPAYDVFTNVTSPMGASSSTAGGLFFSEQLIPGKKVAIGLSQATPMNILFAVDFGITVGLEEVASNNKVELYPNPSNQHITVSGLSDRASYTIYNILGTQISSGTASNKEKINIEGVTSGLYYLKFENGNTLKFVKN